MYNIEIKNMYVELLYNSSLHICYWILGNFLTETRETGGNIDLVIKKHAKNAMDGTYAQRGGFNENKKKSQSYIKSDQDNWNFCYIKWERCLGNWH